MGNSLKLHHTILTFLFKSGVRVHDLRIYATYAWAVVGLLLSHTVNLNRWSQHRVGDAQAASKVRQLARWLHNAKIDPVALFQPLIRQALTEWDGHRLVVALDTTQLWQQFTLVRLSLIYRGRAVPLIWKVVTSRSASVGFTTYAPLLETVAPWLARHPVLFLADSGFVDHRLWRLLRDLNWRFRLRVRQSLVVYCADGRRTKITRLMPPRGGVRWVHKVWLTEKQFGPLYLALGHVQTAQGYEKWAIASDEPTDLTTFDEYGLRFDIEENFLDDKSGGFQLESSRLRSRDAIARLALLLATATLYLLTN